MKISFISNIFPPHTRGGYELGCQTIAQEFARRGHDVEILTSWPSGQLRRAEEEDRLPVRPIFEPIYWYEEMLEVRAGEWGYWRSKREEAFGGVIVGNVLALQAHFREKVSDVIWIFNPLGLGTIGLMEATLAHRSRVLITLMDNLDGTVSHYQQRLFMEARYRRAKKQMNAISCSRKMLLENQRVGSYRSHRVIYNGMAFDRNYAAVETRRSVDGPFRFVCIGQVSESKGILQVVRGASQLRRAMPQASFSVDILGRVAPDFEPLLRKEISAAGLDKMIHLGGFIERDLVLSKLSEYDAAIALLSDLEPFGYAPLEAAAAGLPVILTRTAGVAECFPKDYPLFIDDRKNAAQVGGALASCVQSRGWCQDLGRSLRAHLAEICDFHSVTMPAYERTLRSCPVNPGTYNIDSTIATYLTGRFCLDA